MLKRQVAIVIAAMTMLLLATSQVSEAHSRPIRFTPEPGAVLQTAPSSIQGWFTSDIRNVPDSFIQVFDSTKNRVDTGSIGLSTNRRSMSINLKAGLGEGAYTVYWSTHDDADDEVFAQCYVFFVGQAAADKAIADGSALDGGANCPATATETTGSSVEVSVKVSGTSATVTMDPTNFDPCCLTGTTREPGKGHYHIYLDKIPEELTGEAHSHDTGASSGHSHESSSSESEDPNGLVENPVMWNTNSYTFKDLEPGVHTVAVVLNYADHSSYSPPVVTSMNFVVGDSGGGGGVETWMFIAGLGIAAAVGLAGGRILGKV